MKRIELWLRSAFSIFLLSHRTTAPRSPGLISHHRAVPAIPLDYLLVLPSAFLYCVIESTSLVSVPILLIRFISLLREASVSTAVGTLYARYVSFHCYADDDTTTDSSMRLRAQQDESSLQVRLSSLPPFPPSPTAVRWDFSRHPSRNKVKDVEGLVAEAPITKAAAFLCIWIQFRSSTARYVPVGLLDRG